MALAVVERWPLYRGLNKSQSMDYPSGQNKVAVVEIVLRARGGTAIYGLYRYVPL